MRNCELGLRAVASLKIRMSFEHHVLLCAMILELPISPALAESLRSRLPSLDRAALEGLALEGYRHGALSLLQVGEVLGHSSRWESQDFLASFGCWPDYDAETIADELAPIEA